MNLFQQVWDLQFLRAFCQASLASGAGSGSLLLFKAVGVLPFGAVIALVPLGLIVDGKIARDIDPEGARHAV